MKKYIPYFKNVSSSIHMSYNYFIEGIIKPNSYVEEIKNFFIKNFDPKENFINNLINTGSKYRIIFGIDQNSHNRIFIGGSYNNILKLISIKCTKEVEGVIISKQDYTDYIIKDLMEILGHEIVHRMQYSKKDMDKFEYRLANTQKQYLADRDEMMSYAWQIVEWYKVSGLSSDDIKIIIKDEYNINRKNTPLYVYYQTFKDDKQYLNQLYKYIYMYLEDIE